ncbi:sigma-70 family RNA polymerase sigma factor [Thermovirga lienii]|uniref:sigma-70 family RNA polymerase sigma factor n=1 Tax=Thermovirga lienii TaxID=336261 RepID=UPI00074AD7F4|nr:MAG: RNA polymerase sigma factor [Thermovirga lienii]
MPKRVQKLMDAGVSTGELWLSYKEAQSQSNAEQDLLREKLFKKFQYLVYFVVKKMPLTPPRGLDYEDLISFGNIGLLDAIDRYDPSLGYAFQTYAVSRIRGTILDEIRKFDWFSRTGREKVQALERAAEQQFQEEGKVTNEGLMKRLNVTEEQLDEMLKISQRSYIGYLDEELVLEDSEVDRCDIIAGEEDSPQEVVERNEEIAKLYEALDQLSDRERMLIKMYYFEFKTFREIARELGVSESRVSQLHKRILEKLEQKLYSVMYVEG